MKPDWIQYGFVVEEKGDTSALFKQVHGNKIVNFDQQPPAPDFEADGGLTTTDNLPVYVYTADCLPVLLWSDHGGRPIAALHAGWRGVLKGIVSHAVKTMDVPPISVHAILGPGIGPCCFEVKQDFLNTWQSAGRSTAPYVQTRDGQFYFDLVRFTIAEELPGIGEWDLTSHRCTVCSRPLLPSYRRNGKADPRIRSWIQKAF